MTNKINALSPEIRFRVELRLSSHIEFIKKHSKLSIKNIFGNPAQSAMGAMRAELNCWGITNV